MRAVRLTCQNTALYQKLYIQSKSAPEDGRICRPKYVGVVLKINKPKSCCILLVVYIAVLMMHGHTNIMV